MEPAVVIRPILWLPRAPCSVNQRAPSGAAAMSMGPPSAMGMGNSLMDPDLVMLPLREKAVADQRAEASPAVAGSAAACWVGAAAVVGWMAPPIRATQPNAGAPGPSLPGGPARPDRFRDPLPRYSWLVRRRAHRGRGIHLVEETFTARGRPSSRSRNRAPLPAVRKNTSPSGRVLRDGDPSSTVVVLE
jgi:hypothetical protein